MEEKKNNALEKAEERREDYINESEDGFSISGGQESSYQQERADTLIEEQRQKVHQFKNHRINQDSGSGRRGKKGLIGAVIALSIATIVLASALIVTFIVPSDKEKALEYSYRKSFYDAVEQVDNMDVNLSKVLATNDSSAIQRYLVDVAINSELAENDIQELPLKDENKFYTTKLINQIGDYSKSLNNKLSRGEELTSADREALKRLKKANGDLKSMLDKAVKAMGADFSFMTVLEGGAGNVIISNFSELQNLSVEYPELIYDGPFSDGQKGQEFKGIEGENITSKEALERFNKTFARRGMTDAEVVSENEKAEYFNVQGKVKDDLIFAQFSKKGGKMLMFSFAGSCNSVKIDQDEAVERGLAFLSTQNIENMKPVWVNLASNVYTINFAFTKDDVIVYSDLIKVRVCAETNTVIGMEATGYYKNHTERSIPSAILTKEQAEQKVFNELKVNATRLALVPIGKDTETLCYEFYGEYEGSDYYVYIDATNGRQVEMFKVIKGTEGEFLI